MSDTGMSSALAAWILAEIAAEEGRSETDVTALEMGARRLSARWFQRQRRRARRLTQRNREAESAEPIGVRGSAPDEKNLSDLGLSAPLRETKTESTEAEAAR